MPIGSHAKQAVGTAPSEETSWIAGTPVIEGVGFSIADVGYVCVGNTNVAPEHRVQEVWEYDPLEDSWTRKADFPGAGRSGCTAVTIGAKAYVLGGYSDTYLGETWEYDPALDVWTQKSGCPGGGRFMPCAFAAGDRIYVGTGSGADGVLADFWEYDPASDTWTRKADLPGQPRAYAIGVSIADKGYVGLGVSQFVQPLPLMRDVWQYDPEADAWSQVADFVGQPRIMTSAFALGQDLYVGPGSNANSRNVGDVWRVRPAANP